MWNLLAPPTSPIVPEIRASMQRDQSNAPSSMSMQTPPINDSAAHNLYFNNPVHIADYGVHQPAPELRRPVDSMQSRRELRLHKLSPPPKFESKNLNWRMRNVRYWRDLYSTIDESQVLSSIGLSANDDLKDILMGFLMKL